MSERFPLKAAASTAAKIWTAVGGVVGGLAGVGIITADQNTTLQGLLAAFGVRKGAESLVTPVADPNDDNGTTLTA